MIGDYGSGPGISQLSGSTIGCSHWKGIANQFSTCGPASWWLRRAYSFLIHIYLDNFWGCQITFQNAGHIASLFVVSNCTLSWHSVNLIFLEEPSQTARQHYQQLSNHHRKNTTQSKNNSISNRVINTALQSVFRFEASILIVSISLCFTHFPTAWRICLIAAAIT